MNRLAAHLQINPALDELLEITRQQRVYRDRAAGPEVIQERRHRRPVTAQRRFLAQPVALVEPVQEECVERRGNAAVRIVADPADDLIGDLEHAGHREPLFAFHAAEVFPSLEDVFSLATIGRPGRTCDPNPAPIEEPREPVFALRMLPEITHNAGYTKPISKTVNRVFRCV